MGYALQVITETGKIMRIGVLSFSPSVYSTRRLRESAKARGHILQTYNAFDFTLSLTPTGPRLIYRGKEFERPDVAVPRMSSASSCFGLALVRQVELDGITAVNCSAAMGISRDKMASLQCLAKNKIPLPQTAYVSSQRDILEAIELVGGAPVVVKLLSGAQGVGVMLAESRRSAEAIVETMQQVQQQVLVQHFVAESRGRDLRALVVDGAVVASMRRIAKGDEFRSNVHRGGQTEPIELDSATQQLAVSAAAALGLSIAGVDLLESDLGILVMEVNASPGLEGIEGATGIDVATKIIECIERVLG